MRGAGSRWRSETGQVFVIMALALPVVLGMSAIVVDVGNLFFQKRTLQGAADAAALAAAADLAKSSCDPSLPACSTPLFNNTISNTTGRYSGKNAGTTTLAGLPLCAEDGSVPPSAEGCVTWPIWTSGVADWNRLAVTLRKAAPTAFARVFGISSVAIRARAVAGVTPGLPPPYTFVALNKSCNNHSLILRVGGKLHLDSGVFINSCNDHDGFDIKGTGGLLEAPFISTTGGWEIENGTETVRVGGIDCPALAVPPWASKYKYYYRNPSLAAPFANAPATPGCPVTGQPVLPDPFLNKLVPPTPGDPTLGTGPTGISACGIIGVPGAPNACRLNSGQVTLQPGTYYGGIDIGSSGGTCDITSPGSARVTMAPGTYIMAGGGFRVCGTSTLSAPNVMIYNTNTQGAGLGQIIFNTTGTGSENPPTIDLGPQTSGPYRGLTIFQNPALSLQGGTSTKCPTSIAAADIAFAYLGVSQGTQTVPIYGQISYPPVAYSPVTSLAADMLDTDTQLSATGNQIKVGDHFYVGGSTPAEAAGFGEPMRAEGVAGSGPEAVAVSRLDPVNQGSHPAGDKIWQYGEWLYADMLSTANTLVERGNNIVTGDHIWVGGEEMVAGTITNGTVAGTHNVAVTRLDPVNQGFHPAGDEIRVTGIIGTDTVIVPGKHLGHISGTLYAGNQTALIATDNVSGTANMAVIAGCVLINGSDITFTFNFDSGQLFGLSPSLTE